MRDTILIVDDQSENRDVLREALEGEYKIHEASDGVEAMEYIQENEEDIALVLLDLIMPRMSGTETLLLLHDKKLMDNYPVIICTGDNSLKIVEKCFSYGMSDFIRKPYEKELLPYRVRNVISNFNELKQSREESEKSKVMMQRANALLKQYSEKMKKDNANIIDSLGTIVEYRNTENHDHIRRVKAFSKVLATHMMNEFPEYELTEEKVELIYSASALHDLGKIMIPDNILFKPGKYTSDEFDYMKSHTIRGYDIIQKIAANWDKDMMEYCSDIARYHHEKYDGRGYADGLVGDEIPISAQIVSVADCFEALIGESIYKKAYEFDVAYQMIINGDCGAFNPKLLEAFRNSEEEFKEIAKKVDPENTPEDMIGETNLSDM